MGGFFGPSVSAAGGGVGSVLAYAPPAGVIDPVIAGFIKGLGAKGTGRLQVTLAADTSFEGLPAGIDGQQLFVTVVAGAFTLSLLHLAATAQTQILASADFGYQLNDTAQLFMDGGLNKWVLVA